MLFMSTAHLSAQPTPTQALYPPIFDPSELLPANGADGSAGFVINGANGGDFLGDAMTMAADVNGDGRDDLLVGARRFDGVSSIGAAVLVFGNTQVPMTADGLELQSILAGEVDPATAVAVVYPRPLSRFGYRVRFMGDLDGDGISELGITATDAIASTEEDNQGQTFILYGGADIAALLQDFKRILPANGGDGSEGFVFTGGAGSNLLGHDFFGGHDINGDGHDDLLILAQKQFEPERSVGLIFVLYGSGERNWPAEISFADLLAMPPQQGFLIVPPVQQEFALSPGPANARLVSDLNGDGLAEIAYCARESHFPDTSANGECYVIFGRAGAAPFPALFDTNLLLPAFGGDGSQGFVITGSEPGENLGSRTTFTTLRHDAIDVVGDFDGDGQRELLIGAAGGGLPGKAWLLFGQGDYPAHIDLRQFDTDPPEWPRITRIDQTALGDTGVFDFALVIGAAGDINGDGLADITIHDRGPFSQTYQGAWIIYGRPDLPRVFDAASLLPDNGGDGSRGFLVQNLPNEETLGQTISSGDFNGDGLSDLALGGGAMDPGNRSNAGRVLVLFNRGMPLPPPAAVPALSIWAGLLLALLLIISGGRLYANRSAAS